MKIHLGSMLNSLVLAGLLSMVPSLAGAHCDTMDGPVIKDAHAALDKGEIAPVLKWISANDEKEVRAAFEKALVVRDKGPEAREVADQYFFETLVRLHRAGEGEPYTGLKAAGTPVDPLIAESDKALESGSADGVMKHLSSMIEKGVHERYAKALEAKKHKDETPEAGRAFVAAYVQFVHYVEQVGALASGHAGGHGAEAGPHSTASAHGAEAEVHSAAHQE